MSNNMEVKSDKDENSSQVDLIPETDHKSITEMENKPDDLIMDVNKDSEELNYVTISSDGVEADYHKAWLIVGVLVIFFLGVLVGALVF